MNAFDSNKSQPSLFFPQCTSQVRVRFLPLVCRHSTLAAKCEHNCLSNGYKILIANKQNVCVLKSTSTNNINWESAPAKMKEILQYANCKVLCRNRNNHCIRSVISRHPRKYLVQGSPQPGKPHNDEKIQVKDSGSLTGKGHRTQLWLTRRISFAIFARFSINP